MWEITLLRYRFKVVNLLKLAAFLLKGTRLDRVRIIPIVGGLIAYLIAPSYRRQAVRKHQAMAGGTAFSRVQLEVAVIAAFSNYTRYWISLLVTPYQSALEIASNTKVINRDFLDLVLAQGNGALVVSPHIGNWDFGAAWFATLGGRVLAVTEELDDHEVKEWFWKERRAKGIEPIYANKQSTTQILKALKDNYVVALVSDRDLLNNGVEISFLGETIRIPGGPAVLALRSKTPILPCAIFMSSKNEHNVVFYSPIYPQEIVGSSLKDRVHELTQQVGDAMGKMIQTSPSQWLAFVALSGENLVRK